MSVMFAVLLHIRCLMLSVVLGVMWSSRLLASVLLLGAEYNSTHGEIADVKAKIAATGSVSGSIDTLDISIAASPTLATLQQYDAVLVWSDGSFSNATTIGTNLANYVAGGGGGVQMQFAGQTGASRYGLAGTWVTGGYGVFTTSDTVLHDVPLSLGTVYIPTSPVMENVHTFSGGAISDHLDIAMASGAVRIADWSDGKPLVGTRTIPHGVTPGGVVG